MHDDAYASSKLVVIHVHADIEASQQDKPDLAVILGCSFGISIVLIVTVVVIVGFIIKARIKGNYISPL